MASGFERLAFTSAPPPDPAWSAYEGDLVSQFPGKEYASISEQRAAYAQECRDKFQKATAPGARDHHLLEGVEKKELSISSTVDGLPIRVMQLDLAEHKNQEPEVVIIYFHGGGLTVGEPESEELACRRMVKSSVGRVRLYSIGYRLIPENPASMSHADSFDGYDAFKDVAPKVVIVGSSSGGELATSVSQRAKRGSIRGVLLRSPVTADAYSGKEFIPERLRPYHTSCSPSFVSSIFQYLQRAQPRDGLDRLPLEASREELLGLPRTWIQACSNDTLYSDGLCYAIALQDAGVEVKVDLWKGWPHTFWLKAVELPEALEADKRLLEALKWTLQ